jgi:hypothetical protein
MLNPREATQKALGYIQEIMPDLAEKQDIRLEEVETETIETPERAKLPIWKLTFSIGDPEPAKFIGQQVTPFGFKRVAKIVTLNAEDGGLIAIKQYAA